MILVLGVKYMKKGIRIILSIIGIIIIIVCTVIQVNLKKADEELQKESEKLSTLTVNTTSGKEIEMEYTHVEENDFYVKIPKEFKQLTYEETIEKYSGDIPDVVFANDENNINVVISLTENEMKNNQIKSYQQSVELLLKNNSEILSKDYYEVDGHNVASIELISKGADTDIYNNMICFSYRDKLVIITFNCTKSLEEEWKPVGKFIIDSLFINKE